MNKTRIGGIIQHRNLALVGVMAIPDRPGVLGAIMEALGQRQINMQFIAQSIDAQECDAISFCVDRDDLQETLRIIHNLPPEFSTCLVRHWEPVAIVGVFGPDFRERPGIAGNLFRALAARQINVLAVSTSISTIACVIGEHHLDGALEAIAEAFEFPS